MTIGPFQLTSDAAMESFEDGALILNLKDLTLKELNTTARDILQKTDGQTSGEDVARDIADEYEIDLEEALHDVKELYLQLTEQGLLETSTNQGKG
jgi:hypothetical protein